MPGIVPLLIGLISWIVGLIAFVCDPSRVIGYLFLVNSFFFGINLAVFALRQGKRF